MISRMIWKGKAKDYPGAKAVKETNEALKDSHKGVTVCKAKDCNNELYGWTGIINKKYCMDCC